MSAVRSILRRALAGELGIASTPSLSPPSGIRGEDDSYLVSGTDVISRPPVKGPRGDVKVTAQIPRRENPSQRGAEPLTLHLYSRTKAATKPRKPTVTPILAVAALVFTAGASFATPGDADTTFGTDGFASLDFGGDDFGADVVLQADGKIVMVGTAASMTGGQIAVARFLSDGTPDPDFDGDGKVTTMPGSNNSGRAIAIQSDGRIVVAGHADNGTEHDDFVVVRYNPDGSLDTSFSGDGIATANIVGGPSRQDRANALAIQPDGKIVAVGYSTSGDGPPPSISLVRYLPNGTLDTSFGGTGKFATQVGTSDSEARGVAIDGAGRVLVAGFALNGIEKDFAVVRYKANGELDTTFSFDGKTTVSFGASNDTANAIAIQPDGKIVVAGVAETSGDLDIALARLNDDGTLDATFNSTGKVRTDLPSGDGQALDVALQADSRILIAGSAYSDAQTTSYLCLARYHANGSLDTLFNPVFVNGPLFIGIAGGLAIQRDGRAVLAGYAEAGGVTDFVLARYNTLLRPDGRLGTRKTVPLGNDVYNLTGAGQTQNAAIPRGGGRKTISIGIQNDGHEPTAFIVQGTSGNGRFPVKYLHGSTNVTGPANRGTLTTETLSPGAIYLLKAQITTRTPRKGKRHTFSIITTSAADPTANDIVIIKARSN